MFTKTFRAEYLPAAEAIVAKANKKAARWGIADRYTYTAMARTETKKCEMTGLPYHVEMVDFTLHGAPLSLGGWTFAATITWDSETGLAITRSAPGVEVDLSAHRDASLCEHCNTKRQRIDTYVVVRTDGTTHGIAESKQVGSSCLAAFLGIDAESALWMLGFEDELGGQLDEEFRTGGYEVRHGTEYLLALAAAAVERYGWAASGQERPTAGRVRNVLNPPTGKYAEAARAEAFELSNAIKTEGSTAAERGKAVLEFVRSDAFGGDSDYVVNLKNACAGETVAPRNINLVVSAVSAYKRHVEREVARQAEAAAAPSTHVGTIKERLRNLSLTVTMTRWFEGDYGTTTLIGFVDDAGNRFKWFASGHYDFEAGDEVVLTGTVKEHTEYKGTLETVLNRCKIEEA